MKKQLEERNNGLLMMRPEEQKTLEGTSQIDQIDNVQRMETSEEDKEMKASPSGSGNRPFSIETLLQLTTAADIQEEVDFYIVCHFCRKTSDFGHRIPYHKKCTMQMVLFEKKSTITHEGNFICEVVHFRLQ